MITLFIAFAAGTGAFVALYWGAGVGLGWSIFLGIAALLTTQGVVSYLFLRKIKADMLFVQKIMADGQKTIEDKTRRWQIRPPGSVQEAQRIIAEDMKAFVKKAIAETARLDKYKHWVLFAERQAATARLQLSWMIKDFKTVDALMPKAIMMDPMSAAMKMARMYMLDAKTEEIEKVYKKAVARCRYNENVLPAACWSWILVKRGDEDAAFKALGEALNKSDNATLKANHQHLMNNRILHFNNSGIGDQWYSLHLEEPKIKTQRQRGAFR